MPVAAPAKEEGGYFSRRRYFSLPALRFATVLLVLAGLGYGVWRIGFYQSDVVQGLAELNLGYKGIRPLDARVVGFDYAAPPQVTRGGPVDKDKPEAVERQKQAAATLDKALNDHRNAETLYASGKVLLAKKDFEKAIGLFEEAAGLNPDNANLQSDLGSAYLEMGKEVAEKDSTRGLELLEKGEKHFEKAIKLNPRLPEPLFNLAIVLEKLVKPNEAKKAWTEYIALDPASPWTNEARDRLKKLDEKP